MALKIDFQLVKSVTIYDAYTRIEGVTAHRSSARAPEVENYFSVDVGVYSSEADYLNGEPAIAQRCERVDYDPAGDISFAVIYGRLAPKFTNARNV